MAYNPIAPTSLEYEPGRTILPGLKSRAYFIPKSEIALWPTLVNQPSSGGSMKEVALYTGSFKLVVGKKWRALTFYTDKSPLTSEPQGAKPSKTFINKVVLMVPNTDEQTTAFARVSANDDYVYVLQDKNGAWRVIGNEIYETDTSSNINNGAAATDEIGTTITATVTDICPTPFLAEFDPEEEAA